MEGEEFVGCISCMGTNDLCDLFGAYAANAGTYAKMFEECFSIKVYGELKYLCSECVEKLEKCVSFKDQTVKNISMLQTMREEEYLDESILEEAESSALKKGTDNTDQSETDNMKDEGQDEEENEGQDEGPKKVQKVLIVRKSGDKGRMKQSDSESNEEFDGDGLDANGLDAEEQAVMKALQDTICVYCDIHMGSVEEARAHVTAVHGLDPASGQPLESCHACSLPVTDLADHLNRCHGVKSEPDSREFPCHFCDNVYNTRKACFTHLRMKHGLKLYNDQTPKCAQRERKKCHICNRDFSQKQILNKHLWKAHGVEVEKRKAFLCPLCTERVSYGSHFSAHLLHQHRVHEQVEQLEFRNMDDFIIYKNALQEETKFRFRKTSSSKSTIDGLRSHYMCSQSGIYVYQGKGKRPAPERQIYKTGKACPAHMIVTETMERVLVTFYKTHVGHGLCPYYEPREVKKPRMETIVSTTYSGNPDAFKNSNPNLYNNPNTYNNTNQNTFKTSNQNTFKNSNQNTFKNSDQNTFNNNRNTNNSNPNAFNSDPKAFDNSNPDTYNNNPNAYSNNNPDTNNSTNANTYNNTNPNTFTSNANTFDNNPNAYDDNNSNTFLNNPNTFDNSNPNTYSNANPNTCNNATANTYNANPNTYVNPNIYNNTNSNAYNNSDQQHLTYENLFKAEIIHTEDEDDDQMGPMESSLAWICDTCGMGFLDVEQFKRHIIKHGPKLFPCQYCNSVFENIEAWTRHIQVHGVESLYYNDMSHA